jgi:RND superfamily putative drug exporter
VRRALAFTIAGRISAGDGRLRVAGHLLPGRDAWVRAHVGCVLVDDADAALLDLAEALRGRSSVVVIDGIDGFTGAQRDQASAMLRDAAAGRTLTVFATATDGDTARAILADAGWRSAALLDIRAPRRSVIDSSEVNA